MMGTPNERPTVDEGAASPERLGRVVPLRVAAQPPPPLQELVEQSFRIAIGVTALASEVLAEAVARTLGREPFAEGETPGDETARPAAGSARRGAAIRVALEGSVVPAPPRRWSQRRAFFSLPGDPAFVGTAPPGGGGSGSSTPAGATTPRDEKRPRRSCSSVVAVVDAALDRSTSGSLPNASSRPVIDRLDLDRAIARLNIDDRQRDRPGPSERIDVRAIVERVPVDESFPARPRRDRRGGASGGRAPCDIRPSRTGST
jgi:hypothetical protein